MPTLAKQHTQGHSAIMFIFFVIHTLLVHIAVPAFFHLPIIFEWGQECSAAKNVLVLRACIRLCVKPLSHQTAMPQRLYNAKKISRVAVGRREICLKFKLYCLYLCISLRINI